MKIASIERGRFLLKNEHPFPNLKTGPEGVRYGNERNEATVSNKHANSRKRSNHLSVTKKKRAAKACCNLTLHQEPNCRLHQPVEVRGSNSRKPTQNIQSIFSCMLIGFLHRVCLFLVKEKDCENCIRRHAHRVISSSQCDRSLKKINGSAGHGNEISVFIRENRAIKDKED